MANSKLFPPVLEGALPAFYKTYEDNHKLKGASINIPFSLGRVVSINEISAISMRISTTSSNSLVLTITTDQYDFTDNNMAYFKVSEKDAKKLNEGQYYRVQIAFVDQNDLVGHYSTVGIIKCVAKPTCFLRDMDSGDVNPYRTDVVGVYEQDTYFGDTTEKVYKYRFILTDANEIPIIDSDWILHDTTQDTVSESSRDIFKIYTELEEGEIGNLTYEVITINGLQVSSPPYKVMKVQSVELEYPLELYAYSNFEDGCIELKLHGVYNHGYIGESDLNEGEEAVYSGTFVITRTDEHSNYKEWREITRFIIAGDYASHFGFRDFTVEQGVYYQYGIQQYNINYVYSEKVLSYDMTPYIGEKNPMQKAKLANEEKPTPTMADFEDMFLFDGQRQLKIRFNPKVTSFKITVQEQKQDTIGGKYPFIFRNAHTNYKEFPIGGLLSFTADSSALFLTDEELLESRILQGDSVRRASLPYGAIHAKNAPGATKQQAMAVQEIYGKYVTGEATVDELNRAIRNMPIQPRVNYNSIGGKAYVEQMYWINKVEERDPYTKIVTKKDVYTRYTPQEIREGKTMKGIVYYDPIIASIDTTDKEKQRNDLYLYGLNSNVDPRDVQGVIRQNVNLTGDNVAAERFFKLKVLEWLTDGNVKLFRSPTEGNYLVRILNNQLQPQEQLGRLIHSFTGQAYEVDDVTFDNLVYYKIITNSTPIIASTLWQSIELKKQMLTNENWYDVNFQGNTPLTLYFDDFMPGDQISIEFSETAEPQIYVIGNTGNLLIDCETRYIVSLQVKRAPEAYANHDPIEYSRILTYSFLGLGSSRFDAVFDIKSKVPVAEQFFGPAEDLLKPYDLTPTEEEYQDNENYLNTESLMTDRIYPTLATRKHINYSIGQYADKFKVLTFEQLHVRKRMIIPIYACDNLLWDANEQIFKVQETQGIKRDLNDNPIGFDVPGTLFSVTPFGIGYVNSQLIYDINNNTQTVYRASPNNVDETHDIETLNVIQIEDQLPYFKDFNFDGYSIFKVYIPKVIVNEDNKIEPAMIHKTYYDLLDGWQENPDKNYLYYDTYTHSWWDESIEYDPTFAMIYYPEELQTFYDDLTSTSLILHHPDGTIQHAGDTEDMSPDHNEVIGGNIVDTLGMEYINLNIIDEVTLKNIKGPVRLTLGSGVMAEVSPRLQIIDYVVEERDNECHEAKQKYLEIKQLIHDSLVGMYKDITEINSKIGQYYALVEQIQEKEDRINEFTNAINEGNELANALVTRLTAIDQKMYNLQNTKLNALFNLIKDMRIPKTITDTANSFPYLIRLTGTGNAASALNQQYAAYINASVDNSPPYNYNINNSTLYNRNYLYNNRMKSFYYQADLESDLIPSPKLSFIHTPIVIDEELTVDKWASDEDNNGIYTLWSNKPAIQGDKLFNDMLGAIIQAAVAQKVPASWDENTPSIYNYLDNLYTDVGRLPAWVKNYGDYRSWLQGLLNEKAGKLYAMIHYYNTLPEDLNRVIINNENYIFTINIDRTTGIITLNNHPYADLNYLTETPTDGLLYFYLSGTAANVERNENLKKITYRNTTVPTVTATSKLKLTGIDGVDNITDNENHAIIIQQSSDTMTAIHNHNQAAIDLMDKFRLAANNPDGFGFTYDCKESSYKYGCNISWNIEKDFYYQPVWLEYAPAGNATTRQPGYYPLCFFTETGKAKLRRIPQGDGGFQRIQILNTYNKYEAQYYDTKGWTIPASQSATAPTEQQKAQYLYAMDTAFGQLYNKYNSLYQSNKLAVCEYFYTIIDEEGNEHSDTIKQKNEYKEPRLKYEQDFYYDEYGIIQFTESAQILFVIPDSLLHTDYQGDNNKNLWAYTNGLLVTHDSVFVQVNPENNTYLEIQNEPIEMPEDIVEKSAEWYYYQYMLSDERQDYSMNTAAHKYYEWQDAGKALRDLQTEFVTWMTSEEPGRNGTSGYRLKDIEPIEEELQILQNEYDALRAQMRAATAVMKAEVSAGQMTIGDIRYNELLSLLADLISTTGISQEDFIDYCQLKYNPNIINTDSRIVKDLIKYFGDDLFDKEDIYIAELETIFLNYTNYHDNHFTDINGFPYTYKTWSGLKPNERTAAFNAGGIPNDIRQQINNLVTQINNYVNNDIRKQQYKYLIRAKFNELYDIDNAVILRLRDTYLADIKKLSVDASNKHSAFDTAWGNYTRAVDEISRLYWSENINEDGIEGLGLNPLLMKYQESLDKPDDMVLNDSSISGRLYDYFNMVDELMKLYYLTQLHGTRAGTNFIDPRLDGFPDQLKVKNYNDPENDDYDKENADEYYDDFTSNYSILSSINEMQTRYADLIKKLKEDKESLIAEQKQLGTWTEDSLPKSIDYDREVEEMRMALAKYLATLGYRYYHEVEELYQR